MPLSATQAAPNAGKGVRGGNVTRVETRADRDLNCQERSALQALRETTYPPEAPAARPGRDVKWELPARSALIWMDGALMSRAGLVSRPAAHDGADLIAGEVGE